MLREMTRLIFDAGPSPAHLALGSLEKAGYLNAIITQFGEPISSSAIRESQKANKAMLIVGASGVVYPAAEVPFMAAARGAVVIKVNTASTPFISAMIGYFLEGSASRILPEIITGLGLSLS